MPVGRRKDDPARVELRIGTARLSNSHRILAVVVIPVLARCARPVDEFCSDRVELAAHYEALVGDRGVVGGDPTDPVVECEADLHLLLDEQFEESVELLWRRHARVRPRMDEIAMQQVREVVADVDESRGASSGLVAWELFVDERRVADAWARAQAIGLLRPAVHDCVNDEHM
jgi:hypothetical protein